MRGFLDPNYPSRIRTDYRSVIDGVVVGLAPSAAYGYGNDVRPAQASIGVMGNRDFYSDNNTEMEQALKLIAADTALASSHVIVGDGRRGNPNTANEQYVQLRSRADEWIRKGGTFMVAASMAPFQTVAADPSGCRVAAGGSQTCPLYAFAYVAKGDETRIAAALAEHFEHLFVWPLPALPPTGLHAIAQNHVSDPTLFASWGSSTDSTPIIRVRGAAATNTPLRILLQLTDSTSPMGKTAARAMTGQNLRASLSVRPLSSPGNWEDSPPNALAESVQGNPFAVDMVSRGADQPRFLYRVELLPTGVPTWLEQFDADSAGEPVRTYGLSRLFELFRHLAEQSPKAAGRIYAVVN
ncbi:MAG TPA: hypothetical protein VFE05_21380 [Longimicrobiaceae bacterium]|jgi:hypothetical protein|nr:hypothetical protein [Longimicrobiaceae bacterium]